MPSKKTSRSRKPGGSARPQAFLRQILVDQEQSGDGHRTEDPEIQPKHRNVGSSGCTEQHGRNQQQKAGGLNSRGRLRGGHPRSLPPVAFSTCATSRFENPSISASVRVGSWGCSTTVIAIDFLPSSRPAPSSPSNRRF